MKKVIEVQLKEKFGRRLVYPKNEQAFKICKLLDTKTITGRNIEILKSLGFEIVWIAQTL